MSCPSYFMPQFSTVQVGQLIMYWGLELNVETTRHGSRSCFCKITLETTRAEATHAEATHEEATHHSIILTCTYCMRACANNTCKENAREVRIAVREGI